MRSRLVARAIALVLATSACGTGTPASTSPALPSPAVATSVPTSIAPPVPTPTLPPVVGPDPSAKVGAFYYPWYGTPSIDGAWVHWTQGDRRPPTDIASDYYPRLGAYSSNDQLIVAQHMAWLRQAGVGVAITSWWGTDTFEDRAVPLLLRMAERYGIKIAFHIEPYGTRTATRLRDDVQYLYQRYGTSPAFYRSTSASRYSTGGKATGMFFVWCVEFSGLCGSRKVEPGYWRDAVDAVHALPDGGLIIANTLQTSWVEADHFDGLYNYITLKADRGAFDWSRELPPGSLYIPSVAPGMSAKRIRYAPETYLTRDGGRTFDAQWTAALGTGVQPEMVTITSFNEWHEGTMIEPLALGASDSLGSPYSDFGAVAPDGYLSLTRTWIDRYAQVT